MADKTSIIIDMKDSTTEKTVQRSITYVNPNAENSAMNALAQGIAGLTNNTFVGATRVDRTELTADTRQELVMGEQNTVTTYPDTLTAAINTKKQLKPKINTSTPQAYQNSGKYIFSLPTSESTFIETSNFNSYQRNEIEFTITNACEFDIEFIPDDINNYKPAKLHVVITG